MAAYKRLQICVNVSTLVKYLGVELDQSLTGDGVAEKIISKSNAKLKFIKKIFNKKK